MAALISFPIAEAAPLPFPWILLLLQLTQCGSLMLRLMSPPEHASHPTPTPLTLQTNATRPQFSPDSDRVHPSTTNSHFSWLLLLSKLRGSKKCKTCHNAWRMGSRSNVTDNSDAGSPSVHRAYSLPPSSPKLPLPPN